MLTPCTPSAVANIVKSSALDATSGTYTASTPAARNAALCIAGETECVSGEPDDAVDRGAVGDARGT